MKAVSSRDVTVVTAPHGPLGLSGARLRLTAWPARLTASGRLGRSLCCPSPKRLNPEQLCP